MAWPKFERTEAHRKKIGDALRGRKQSAEQVEKNRMAHVGQKVSEETRQKLRKIDYPARFAAGHEVPSKVRAKIGDANRSRTGLLRKYGIERDEYERQITAGNRWCIYRKHFEPAARFNMSKTQVCDGCKREYNRRSNLKKSFGIDQGWYDAKIAEQGGVCALCKSPDPANLGGKFFAVDHDHKTGLLRGFLCSRCNQGMERVDTVPNWAAITTAYVARYAVTLPVTVNPGVV